MKCTSSYLQLTSSTDGRTPLMRMTEFDWAFIPFRVLVFFPRGQSSRGVKLTSHFRLVPMLRMSTLPSTTSWSGI